MIDENWDHLRARRNNVRRYRRLLQTELTELERRYIERRLNEEKSAMESLTSSTAPLQNPRTDCHISAHSLAAEKPPAGVNRRARIPPSDQAAIWSRSSAAGWPPTSSTTRTRACLISGSTSAAASLHWLRSSKVRAAVRQIRPSSWPVKIPTGPYAG